MSTIVECCHAAVISACDDSASDVCHQLGRDFGDESFSGFEFRHLVQPHIEVRCHMLHERYPESQEQWAVSTERISNVVSNFFDLDTRSCPLILICVSQSTSSVQLLSHHLLPMILKRFPNVAVIAIQSHATSSEPSEFLAQFPLMQCISHFGNSVPASATPLIANAFYLCFSHWRKRTPVPVQPHLFVDSFRSSSPTQSVTLESYSVPVSPIARDRKVITNAVPDLFDSANRSHADVQDSTFPAFSSNTSCSTLGLSLRWGSDGLSVQEVIADSLAGKSDLFKVGDLILNVDGIDVAASRASRHAAVDRLRQAIHTPVQICARAGPGWQGHHSRQLGSMILFQLGNSAMSPQTPSNSSHVGSTTDDDDPKVMFTRARQCFINGDSGTASTYLLNAARRNYPPACSLLACFYLNGSGGLPHNAHLAFSLARWSSLQKDPDGMGILACCFLFGYGTRQDLGLAFTFAVGSADSSPHGQFCLGYMYHFGVGVAKDAGLAERWISLAVENGHIGAQQFVSNLATITEPFNPSLGLTLMIGASQIQPNIRIRQ